MTKRQVLPAQRAKRHGTIVRSRKQLAEYTGWRAFPEPLRSFKKHSPNEPPMSEEVRLCPETAQYLYSKFTPTNVTYKPGSRTVLEALLNEIILRDGPRPPIRELVFRI